jgi:hypothetical protein
MLTAMAAVDSILFGKPGKPAIWQINTDKQYHDEEKQHESCHGCRHPT